MEDSALPLKGLTVIELFAIGPVPFVGLQLQHMGAKVLRILAPADRGIGIEVDSHADLLNIGKQTQRLNLKTDAGRQALDTLLEQADVLLEGFRPGVLEKLGMPPERLLENNPFHCRFWWRGYAPAHRHISQISTKGHSR